MKIYAALTLACILSTSCSDAEFAGKAPGKKAYSSSGDSSTNKPEGSSGIDDSTIIDETGKPNTIALNGACDEKKGKKDYHLRSSSNSETISAFEHSNIKVTGTNNVLTIKLAENQTVESICIDIAGDENKINFILDGKLGEISIKARGHDPIIDILTNKTGELSKVSVDGEKHLSKIVVHGEGKHP